LKGGKSRSTRLPVEFKRRRRERLQVEGMTPSLRQDRKAAQPWSSVTPVDDVISINKTQE